MFNNADSVYINGKEVQSIIKQDGGVLYQLIQPKGYLSFTGQTFTVISSSQGFSGSEIIIDWGDGTTTTYTNKNSLNHTYAMEGDYEISLNGNITSFNNYCFQDCSGLTSIVIPDSVTSMGKYCLYGCSGLTSVVISEGITSLREGCFYGCSGLTSVVIPEGVTSMENYCFEHCSSLTSIIIPDSVTSMGNYCFAWCSSLTSIIIPDSVTSLGNYCFYRDYSLTRIYLNWDTSNEIITYNSLWIQDTNENLKFIIPNGTTQLYVDKGYPIGRLCEENNAGLKLSVTSDKNVLSYANGDIANITATLKENCNPISGETIWFCGDNVGHNDPYIIYGSDKSESIVLKCEGDGKIVYRNSSKTEFRNGETLINTQVVSDNYISTVFEMTISNNVLSYGMSGYPQTFRNINLTNGYAKISFTTGVEIISNTWNHFYKTEITDNNGEANVSYNSQGIGDVNIKVEYMDLQEIYTIGDYE